MEVRLPRLGEGADSGTVASLLIKVGDTLAKDQAILELESEKAVATIPSPDAGTVSAVHVKEGDTIRVGQLIVTLGAARPGEAPQPGSAPPQKIEDVSAGDGEPSAETRREAPQPEGPEVAQRPEGPAPAQLPEGIPPPAAPTIRRLARELGIDLQRVRGSERGGRIVMADLRRYVQKLQQQPSGPGRPAGPAPAASAPPPPVDFGKWGPVEKTKLTGIRTAISAKMTESWTTVPHVTQFDEADITDLLDLKKKNDKGYEEKGGKLTLTAFALKAVVGVLQKHPLFNSSLDLSSGEIVQKKYFHIGIAVDTEQGLIVPVLRDVDRKSMLQLATELDALAERTRQRKVALDEMQGGSFTISNQGGIGSGHFTPIVNVPQVAILGIGRGRLRPFVRSGKMANRMMLPLSLSYDHRAIDGANAARFMVDLVAAFERFDPALLKQGL
jgi:pyruvate dehydrogenase E2 component (dihydrolipoamide acetyltransferase)